MAKLYPMKEVSEELKTIRNSSPKQPMGLSRLKKVAKKMNTQHPLPQMHSRQLSIARRLHPPCYSMFTLTSVPIKSLHEETLFYIFYALVESEIQIRAYNELITRNYTYSCTQNCFIHDCAKVADGKRRNMVIFDPIEWIKTVKEILCDDAMINGLMGHVDEQDNQVVK